MANNYSPGTPVDKYGIPKIGYPPAKVALASTDKENASGSSVLALTHDTTEIEVSAVGQGVAGRWSTNQATSVVTAAGSANFDFVVSANTEKRFVVPIATFAQSSGSIQGVNRELGLFTAVAFKTLAGNGSVLTAEF